MNQLTKKAILYSKFHSRAWVPDCRREAPNFTHWFLRRVGWGTSLGLHTDPAQLQGVGGTRAPPHLPALAPCLLVVWYVLQGWEGLSAHNGRSDIKKILTVGKWEEARKRVHRTGR